jgi:phage terminase large subunit-like protein
LPKSWIESLRPPALEILCGLSDAEADALLHDWPRWSRTEQRAPDGAWQTWLYLAGRGAGKTRSGAEWVRAKIKSGCRRIALIAPTAADAREVMVEGQSGILSTAWAQDRDAQGGAMGTPVYEPSKRRLTWANGAIATTYSAEEPDRLRGPQHDALWADELAAWADPDHAWDMAMFGLRLGTHPQAMVTTTPRPIPIVREMLAQAEEADASVVITRGRTHDNMLNLAPSFLHRIVRKYEGTRLGRQELDAEVIDEVPGALWTRDAIEAARLTTVLPLMKRTVIAIDPATSSGGQSALTGIVGCGLGFDNKGYVLADRSGRYSPGEWANAALSLYDALQADRIVAEGNQGGEMVRHTLTTVRANAPVRIVFARHGKQARAEPVAALSEQRRIVFAGVFAELEDQLCTWAPLEGLASPDRLDAFVWGFTDLMLSGAAAPVLAGPILVTGERPSPG